MRLKAEACEVIQYEKVSGVSRKGRDELATVIDFLRPGDELMVTRLDRLGRDTRDVLNLIHECEQKVHSSPCSTRTSLRAVRWVTLIVLGMVAQMERRFIKERQREGIEQAKREGVYRGGKRRLDREKVLSMRKQGKTPTAIAAELGC